MLKPLILSAMLAAIAGCGTVGSNFVTPQGPSTAAYRHIQANDLPTTRLATQWWTVFGDATLDALEQRALIQNPGIKASAQRLLQAQAQLGMLQAAQYPSISAATGISNSRTSSNTSQGIAFGHRSIVGNNYSVGASMSYEIDLWGRVKHIVEAADAQTLAAQDDHDGVMLLLSAQIAASYWQLRGMDAEMAILQGALGTRIESEQLIEARLNGGLSNELDVSRARIERANAQADLHEVQRQRNLIEHSLATLVGVSPSTVMVSTTASDLPLPPTIPVGLPASLLAQRPDLAASVASLRGLNAQVGVAEGAFYPSVTLTANFGYASESLRELAQGGSRQFSLGPFALSLPLFDGGRNKANLSMAKARYDEAVANHESKLLNALREVEDALSDTQQRERQSQAQDQAKQAAARAFLVAQARYERGISNYLDVIDAQRSALSADRAAVQIRTQRLLASVAVARALGAGWENGPALVSMLGK
ncbi:MAG: efflux transporter outer membrane subunit [Cytophaga sp.]|nr:efflux transporter outer membrane subunit [Undibacterium sp.]